jgi:uncharacterized RmlC-like cupin family protein
MGIQEAGDTIFIPAANPHAAAIWGEEFTDALVGSRWQ